MTLCFTGLFQKLQKNKKGGDEKAEKKSLSRLKQRTKESKT
jgi:hypothetical protein